MLLHVHFTPSNVGDVYTNLLFFIVFPPCACLTSGGESTLAQVGCKRHGVSLEHAFSVCVAASGELVPPHGVPRCRHHYRPHSWQVHLIEVTS